MTSESLGSGPHGRRLNAGTVKAQSDELLAKRGWGEKPQAEAQFVIPFKRRRHLLLIAARGRRVGKVRGVK